MYVGAAEADECPWQPHVDPLNGWPPWPSSGYHLNDLIQDLQILCRVTCAQKAKRGLGCELFTSSRTRPEHGLPVNLPARGASSTVDPLGL